VSNLLILKGHFWGGGAGEGVGSRSALGPITMNGMLNRLNDCVIFIVHSQFTNVTAGRIIQPGGPRVGDPFCKQNIFIFDVITSLVSMR
jgi:hypothetical protein